MVYLRLSDGIILESEMKMDKSSPLYQTYVKILEKELICAMGCTEPVALAYCAAKARSVLGEIPDKIEIEASGNIIKNVKSVATIISSLRSTLKEYGIEKVLVRARNSTAVDTNQLKCDVYELYNGSEEAKNLYNGEYMANYSWAEFTNAHLISYTNFNS